MKRISPLEKTNKSLEAILSGGCQEGSVFESFFKLAIQKAVQEMLEHEVNAYLGRGPYERIDEPDNIGYRNGYKQRYLKTAEGLVDIHLPQLRATENPYQSKLWTYLKGNSDMLKHLVAKMYARGLSTRDIEEMFTDENGSCLMSKSQVS